MAKQDLQQHEEQDQNHDDELPKKPEATAPALRPEPWLVCLHGKKDKRSQTFYSLSERRYHVENIPDIRAHEVCTSSHGWLILMLPYGKDCFLLNPATMEKIQLPDWPDNSDHRECLLSSPPPNINDPTADSSCVVMFTLDTEEQIFLFCKPGDDHWTKHEVKQHCTCHLPLFLVHLVIFNGEFYALPDCCDILFKVQVNRAEDDRDISHGYHLTLLNLNVTRPDTLVHSDRSHATISCMVQYSPTELLIIEAHYGDTSYNENDVKDIGIKGIELYKVNVHKGAWEKVEALPDDCAIFKGYTTCIGIYRIPREYLDSGIFRGNTIYFTQRRDMYLYAYDVQERSITISLPYPHVRRDYYQPEWILTLGWSSMTADPQPEVAAASKDASPNHIVLSDNSVGDGWCDIPYDLLCDIQSRLLGADRCCFRLACKTWQSSFSNSTSEPDDDGFAKYRFPVLIHKGQDGEKVNLFNPITNSTSILPLPELNLRDAVIHCAKYGWLLMSQGHSSEIVSFFNPFTKERIDLPNKCMSGFQGITFSSPPTSSDCIVLGYFISPEDVELIFIRQGEHRWSYSEMSMDGPPFEHSFDNPVYHQGLIYITGKHGNVFIYELTEESRVREVAKLLNLPSKPCQPIRRSHLLESNGKLLSIFTGHIGSFLQVYELNQEIMAWKELDSLEDTMLFLSSTSSLSATSNGTDISGLGNKVFLDRFNGKDGVFYSLATTRFHTFWSGYNSDDWCDTKGYTNCAWVEPNFERHTEAELRWFDPALQDVEDVEE